MATRVELPRCWLRSALRRAVMCGLGVALLHGSPGAAVPLGASVAPPSVNAARVLSSVHPRVPTQYFTESRWSRASSTAPAFVPVSQATPGSGGLHNRATSDRARSRARAQVLALFHRGSGKDAAQDPGAGPHSARAINQWLSHQLDSRSTARAPMSRLNMLVALRHWRRYRHRRIQPQHSAQGFIPQDMHRLNNSTQGEKSSTGVTWSPQTLASADTRVTWGDLLKKDRGGAPRDANSSADVDVKLLPKPVRRAPSPAGRARTEGRRATQCCTDDFFFKLNEPPGWGRQGRFQEPPRNLPSAAELRATHRTQRVTDSSTSRGVEGGWGGLRRGRRLQELSPIGEHAPCLNNSVVQLWLTVPPGAVAQECVASHGSWCTVSPDGRVVAVAAPVIDVLWEALLDTEAAETAPPGDDAEPPAAGVHRFATRLHLPWVQERRPDIFLCEKTAPPWRPLSVETWNVIDPAPTASESDDDADIASAVTEEEFPQARAVVPVRTGLAHSTRFFPGEGVRIRSIVTADTTSVRAMQQLGSAKTREEVVQTCRQFADACVLQEHATVPLDYGWPATSWELVAAPAATLGPKPPRHSGPRPDCKLWVAELHRTPQCALSLGSWMLACTPVARDSKRLAALFTQTAARWCDSPQPLILVQPGYSWPQLLRGGRTQWTISFVELERRTQWFEAR